ncbi:MAG: transcriptional regulator [Candidatus Poribacteria bacterium]|nr:MAG: transcriptional regulator [Candidatus Poribacteria bacterium]
MTKQDLVDKVASSTGLSKKQTAAVVDSVIEAISDALASGEKVSLIGFGTFEVRERSAREGRNPQTGAKIQIPARKVPAFRPGKALRDRVG